MLDRRLTRRDFFKSAIACSSGLALLDISARMVRASGQAGLGFAEKTEAMYCTKAGPGLYKCTLCPNMCTLKEGMRSICLVRQVENGKPYTFAWSNPTAVHIDPIEKKPLYHFLPASTAFSIATAGCNFSCLNCQNWQISQFPPEETYNIRLTPAAAVEEALSNRCATIAYTYSEPSIFFEYMLHTARIAKEKGIRNASVTNGYLNPDPLTELCPYLDAANVDLKGFSEDFYMKITGGRLRPVLDTLVLMKDKGVHVEITNLVIPGMNDSDSMLRDLTAWVRKNLGPSVPLHFSRFSPRYKLRNLSPTPVATLKKAKDIALSEGMEYVYIGNTSIPGSLNTFCCSCGRLLVERRGYTVNSVEIENGACSYCKNPIPGIWV